MIHYNKSVIQHYNLEVIPIRDLGKMVKISPDHLKEKSTWYLVDGILTYFKERQDYRLFTELFCEEYGKVLGFNMAEYRIAYVKDNGVYGTRKNSTLGLLSPNYQNKASNYYLLSDLQDVNISTLSTFGDYSLENLLLYLSETIGSTPNYENVVQTLINLYLFDFFTNQYDRNPKNICMQMDVIRAKRDRKNYTLHSRKITNADVTCIFDNEKSLGLKKTAKGYNLSDDSLTWESAMPYSLNEDEEIDGLNASILCLLMDHEKYARPLIERLAYESEYKKVIEHFSIPNSQVFMDEQTKKHLLALFLGKQEELKRVLRLF